MHVTNIIESIDTHTAGNPTRNLIAGVPDIPGNTMQEKMAYAKEHLGWLVSAVMQEPRGHGNMSGTIWLPPCHPEAHMGILFIDASGLMSMCGHSTIGCVTAMLESGRIPITGKITEVNIDTAAGLVRTRALVENGRVKQVTFRNVPSFLYRSGTVEVPGFGPVPYDVAFGGNTYAITDAANMNNLTLRPAHLSDIIKAAQAFGEAVRKEVPFVHPTDPFLKGISHVMFNAKPDDPKATFRNTVIFLPSSVDRSPCGTGTSARVASLFAKGQLGLNEEFVHESIIGTQFTARIVEAVTIGTCKGGVPEVSGRAHFTGLHKFVIDPEDPLRFGFRMD
ncbi:proline racemase family protein [Desulfovibrio cuneatus]|uniref:proline racemase family protein n=1 Tax=Desulfovibrio cuneatus TaxID=159728 RepID=UPI00041E9A5D|nr:proline racemase family protein [Desulfovibrio cuneatus]